ncbi:MAG: hypothetical protein KBD19_04580 [Candidatus Moranbacteria bacterium]|nr:hypothetical protein [Candidatus Moranbacteria bacterium]
MMKSLLAGILAAFAALILELIVSVLPEYGFGSPETFITATGFTPILLLVFATIEESSKTVFLWKIIPIIRDSSPFLVRTALFAAGFGTTEILIALSSRPDLTILPAVGIFSVHITTVFLYAATLEKFPRWLPASVFFGILFHFLYNMILA